MSASRQAVVQVIYPKEARGDFNMTYYLESHMPLVQKLWGPLGLKSWTINVLQPDNENHTSEAARFASVTELAVSASAAAFAAPTSATMLQRVLNCILG